MKMSSSGLDLDRGRVVTGALDDDGTLECLDGMESRATNVDAGEGG